MRGRINVRHDKGAELGLLHRVGTWPWPEAAARLVPAKERAQIEMLLAQAVQEVRDGTSPVPSAPEVRTALERVRGELIRQVNELAAADYIMTKRFLVRLQEAAQALDHQGLRADLGVAAQLPAQGQSVAALAGYMNEKGLRFAPPLPGDEAAYQDLQRAFAAYAAARHGTSPASRPPDR